MRSRGKKLARKPRVSMPNLHSGLDAPTSSFQLDRIRRESTGTVAFIPGDVPVTGDEYLEDQDDPDYEFPLWWFFLALPSQSFGPWIVGNTLWGIVVPHTLAVIYGDKEKAFVLATLGTLGTVMSFASPFTGSLSDRLPELFPNFCARFGRRRPFFCIGQVTGVTGIYFSYWSFVHNNTPVLYTSWAVSNLSWQIAGPPYGAIFQETIPESQRGLAVTINGWLCQICVALGGFMGILLGEGHITAEDVWWFQIVIGYCQIPCACWAMSGRACSPFWW
jgi:MFS family permease